MARRNRGLDDELAAMDGTDPDQEPDRVIAVSGGALPTPAPAAPALDMGAFADVLAKAIAGGTATAIRETKDAPRENDKHPDESVYNPLGERDHPRPKLKCPMYWAVYDEREPSKVPTPLYEIEGSACTYEEVVLLNAIEPWEGTVDRNDDRKEAVRVVPTRDMVSNAMTRLVFGFRREMFEKENRNQLPALRRLARQILDQQQPGLASELVGALEERAKDLAMAG